LEIFWKLTRFLTHFHSDQTLTTLFSTVPPKKRAAALERYPDLANMPTSLVYELILNLAEGGRLREGSRVVPQSVLSKGRGWNQRAAGVA
jgi:hypothetical protein